MAIDTRMINNYNKSARFVEQLYPCIEPLWIASHYNPLPVYVLTNRSIPTISTTYDDYGKPQAIIINPALIDILNNDELASAVGHEIGHIVAGHKPGRDSPFREYDADRISIELGVNPKILIVTLKKLELYNRQLESIYLHKIIPKIKIGSFFCSHDVIDKMLKIISGLINGFYPSAESRIIRLKQMMATCPSTLREQSNSALNQVSNIIVTSEEVPTSTKASTSTTPMTFYNRVTMERQIAGQGQKLL
jgi:hypothetical protein